METPVKIKLPAKPLTKEQCLEQLMNRFVELESDVDQNGKKYKSLHCNSNSWRLEYYDKWEHFATPEQAYKSYNHCFEIGARVYTIVEENGSLVRGTFAFDDSRMVMYRYYILGDNGTMVSIVDFSCVRRIPVDSSGTELQEGDIVNAEAYGDLKIILNKGTEEYFAVNNPVKIKVDFLHEQEIVFLKAISQNNSLPLS